MMKVNENIVIPQEQNQGASRGQLLWLGCFAVISAIIGLLVTGRHNYLLFHSLVELGAVAVAWSVFFLVRIKLLEKQHGKSCRRISPV
ncbi:MAG: hypothetical protein U9P10_07300 [Thermodesulfobacteriota bacterium]|nr:hypothetical protein [Thermodesulfobacteriota bacterium]